MFNPGDILVIKEGSSVGCMCEVIYQFATGSIQVKILQGNGRLKEGKIVYAHDEVCKRASFIHNNIE